METMGQMGAEKMNVAGLAPLPARMGKIVAAANIPGSARSSRGDSSTRGFRIFRSHGESSRTAGKESSLLAAAASGKRTWLWP